MKDESVQRIAFGIVLFVVTAAFLWLIRGFLQPVFWAVALGIVFFPAHAKIRARLNGRESVAAGPDGESEEPVEVAPPQIHVNQLLLLLLEHKGSDLHLSSEVVPMVRRHGELPVSMQPTC